MAKPFVSVEQLQAIEVQRVDSSAVNKRLARKTLLCHVWVVRIGYMRVFMHTQSFCETKTLTLKYNSMHLTTFNVFAYVKWALSLFGTLCLDDVAKD